MVRWGVLTCVLLWTTSGIAQQSVNRSEQNSLSPQSADLVDESIRQLREQVRELRAAVDGMRSDWQQSRAETSELRRALDEVRSGAAPRDAVLRNAVASSATTLSNVLPNNPPQDQQPGLQPEDRKSGERAATLEEEYQLLSGKVDDQYQTKVESASKYRLRVSGIVLMNLFSNQGVVDNIDFPMYAYARPAGDSGGASARPCDSPNSGLRLSANRRGREDEGGFAARPRRRISFRSERSRLGVDAVANGHDADGLDRHFGCCRAGCDLLLANFANVVCFAGDPGSLWRGKPVGLGSADTVEHRVGLGEQSSLLLQGGILDPLTGEAPYSGYSRLAGPGEESRQPAYAARIAWTHGVDGQPLRLGVGGYYNRQDYGYGQNVDAWAAMTDIELPLGSQFSLSGKLYRGKGLVGSTAHSDNPRYFPGLRIRRVRKCED